MTSSGSVFSETLQSITDEKLAELSKKRSIFEERKAEAIRVSQAAADIQAELRALLDGVKICFDIKTSTNNATADYPDGRFRTNLQNIERFLGQAQYNPSVSSKLIDQWKLLLIQFLDEQSAKYEYASLYAALVTEWLSSEKKLNEALDVDDEDLEDLVSKERLEVRAKWERAVFEAHETDENAIAHYLSSLFETPDAQKALASLKRDLERFESQFIAEKLDQEVVNYTIKALISSDLLTDDKRAVLKDFKENALILGEIADVLNMRLAALDTWTWGPGVPLEQRKKLNGTYSIYMHEDLLQAIFLQYIGVKWSVFFKNAFKRFLRTPAWTKLTTDVPQLDKLRREHFLGTQSQAACLQNKRQIIHRDDYFMAQLMDHVRQDIAVDEGDEEAEYDTGERSASQEIGRSPRARQTARTSTNSSARQMANIVQSPRVGFRQEPEFDAETDSEDEEGEVKRKSKNPMALKQSLLHLLSTEILINTRTRGELSCFHAEFDRWNSALPHSTIRSVIRFLGVSMKWLAFFDRFMEAPLAFPGEEPRLRKRGIPASHSISEVLGETVLFCVEYAVNRSTNGQLLYRMHDDFWFWSSSHQTCVVAWKVITQFAKVMGVGINESKSGSVRITQASKENKSGIPLAPIHGSLPQGKIRWGFLYLDPRTGRFTVDEKMVDKHINELQHQLTDKHSIFAWIQAWNTYATTFFTTNFGKPAYCYGHAHIDQILSHLSRIQSKVFGSESVVQSLKSRLQQRFGIENIPDGYIFFPAELGGLEVKSPFIGVLQIRESLPEDPEKLLDEFLEDEREQYRLAKLRYEKDQVHKSTYDVDWKPKKQEPFFSFDEYTRHREEFERPGKDIRWVFNELMRKPKEKDIKATQEVVSALKELTTDQLGSFKTYWSSMTFYWRWVAQLYGPEMIAEFGGMSVVDAGLLPIGMVTLFRSGRVKWRG